MPRKGKLKMCLHELMFKRLWKSCVKGRKESVRYVLKHSKMQYWHLALTAYVGNVYWQVGEIRLLAYVLFVGIFKLSVVINMNFIFVCSFTGFVYSFYLSHFDVNFPIMQFLNIISFCRKIISKQDLITAPTESRFQIDIEKNWVESSKVVALLHELENLRFSGSKSIVFSQWTAFLDLLQIPLSR